MPESEAQLGRQKPFTPQTEETSTQQKASVSFSPGGFLLLTDMNLDVAGIGRQTARQFQRVMQFQRLTGITDQWEKNLDGVLSVDQEEPTRRMLRFFRHIAASWYAGEISKEPLAKQVVDDANRQRLPELDSVLSAAEEIVRLQSINLTDVENEVDGVLNPKPTKQIDPQVNQCVSEAKKRKKQESSQKPDSITKGVEELRDVHGDKIQTLKTRKNGVLYTHDSSMDEPTPSAAKYFRELFDCPF